MLAYLNQDFVGSKKLLIFDRDNTLNHDKGYTYKLEDLSVASDLSAISSIVCGSGFGFAIVSNQSGIDRLYFTFQESLLFTNQIARLICPDLSHWLGFICCPHTPEAQCICMKPSASMLDKAISYALLARKDVVFFGDSEVDSGAASRAQIEFRLSNVNNIARRVESWYEDVSN